MDYTTLIAGDEVYKLLCIMKEEHESFNNLITRLICGNRKNILKFQGQLSDSPEFSSLMTQITATHKKEQEHL